MSVQPAGFTERVYAPQPLIPWFCARNSEEYTSLACMYFSTYPYSTTLAVSGSYVSNFNIIDAWNTSVHKKAETPDQEPNRTLSLDGRQFAQALRASSKTLTGLDLSYNDRISDLAEILIALKDFGELTRLRLNGVTLTDADQAALDELSQYRPLLTIIK
jgi:hypothetical protein